MPERAMAWRTRTALRSLAQQSGLRLTYGNEFIQLSKGVKLLRFGSRHAIYVPHMIESFDYYFDSVVPVETENGFLVDLSTPRYHRLVGFEELPFLFPSQSEPYVTTSQYLDFADLGEGKVVLDIGAYAGVTSIIFGKLVGKSGAVFAFEADSKNITCARVNIELASRWIGLTNINLVEKAVWSDNAGLEFSSEGTMGSSAVSIVGPGRGGETKRVPSTTIADFCASREINRVDFIKIDIEGGEVEVLRESANFLSGLKPRLIVEPHNVDGTMSTGRCQEILTRAGFEVELVHQIGSSTPLIAAKC